MVHAQEVQPSNEKTHKPYITVPPPLSQTRLLGQVTAGAIGGGLGYVGGSVAGALIANCSSNSEAFCGLEEVLLGGVLGWVAGTSTGIFLTGQKKGIKASVSRTYLGVVLGSFAALFLLENNESSDSALNIIISFTVPSIAGVIAFNKTRRYTTKLITKSSSWKSSILFAPSFQYHKVNQTQEVIASIKLLDLKF